MDSFVASFNDLNTNHVLEEIEYYEWELILALQNTLQAFYSSAVTLSVVAIILNYTAYFHIHEIQISFSSLLMIPISIL